MSKKIIKEEIKTEKIIDKFDAEEKEEEIAVKGEVVCANDEEVVEIPKMCLTDGSPVISEALEINPVTEQQKDRRILYPEEIVKREFIKPVRYKYRHLKCRVITTINQELAETFATNPKFYSGTFCSFCRSHYPLNEFIWMEDGENLGGEI